MTIFPKSKLRLVTVVYWFLLLYIIAALIWWFIALERQNRRITEIRIDAAEKQHDTIAMLDAIADGNRKTAQYIGEGVTFLALILVGAVFVYRAVRRQIRLAAQQQNFMMAITHELKTPIAVAKLNLETLQKRKLDETKQQKLITNTLQEAGRLDHLCNNILLASRLEGDDALSMTAHEVNLSEVAINCVQEARIHYASRVIQSDIEDGMYIYADELMMQLLINNLIDNAIKYSPKDQPIALQLTQNQGKAHLMVSDFGKGIADADKKRIFEKFYRSGDENTRTTKGTGLGLYLCSKIVKHFGGNITVTNNSPQGAIFTTIFTAV
jgi:two-component system, OmpR family, sensor histidine kinase CiaH